MGNFPLGEKPPGHKRKQGDMMHKKATGIAPQKLMEVRIRVASGYYDHPAVFMAAAEKMLEKGDIEPRG